MMVPMAISGLHTPIREIHNIGADTPERLIPGGACPAMLARRIMFMGLSDAGAGYEMSRPAPDYIHLLISTGGQGEVLLDGKWQVCEPATAYLAPPLVAHAFRTRPRQRWQFCFIYYQQPAHEASVLEGHTPSLIRVDPRPLYSAMEGMYLESVTSGDPSLMDGWVELIHAYAMRLTHRQRGQDRLWRLWAEVDTDLAAAWTLQNMAERATMSSESLRRLCLRQFGQSPVQRLVHLRLKRASALLQSTPDKLDSIAQRVGYSNAFAFSSAFKRWSGLSPAAFRRQASRHEGVPRKQRI